jgi:hypothetical protein
VKHLTAAWFCGLVLTAIAVPPLLTRAAAQSLPPAPVFDAPGDACGKGALVYQPTGNSFVLTYDGSLAADNSRRYRLHFDGTSRASLESGDKLPQKLGTIHTLDIGSGKTVDLNVTSPIFARLRAYDAQGRESEPANLTLVPLNPPTGLVVSSGSPTTLSWTATTYPQGAAIDPLIAAKGYQVFRFACNVDTTSICTTQAGTYLNEVLDTAFVDNDTAGLQYRYGVHAFIRFNDGSPAVVSPALVSGTCNCTPTHVDLTKNGLDGRENGSAKFVLPQPVTSTATLTVSETVCWNSSGSCTPGFGLVPPAGEDPNNCIGQPDCTASGMPVPTGNIGAFVYRVGSLSAPPHIATAAGSSVSFTLQSLAQGTEIDLQVNDAKTDNNSQGFTVNLSYDSAPQCSGQ